MCYKYIAYVILVRAITLSVITAAVPRTMSPPLYLAATSSEEADVLEWRTNVLFAFRKGKLGSSSQGTGARLYIGLSLNA